MRVDVDASRDSRGGDRESKSRISALRISAPVSARTLDGAIEVVNSAMFVHLDSSFV